MRFTAICFVISSLCLIAEITSATAAEFVFDNDVVIDQPRDFEEDLYIFGNVVQIKSDIQGDLVASCNTLIVEGNVQGSILAAANSVRISGEIGQSVRITGNQLIILESAQINRDLVAAGNTLDLRTGSIINRDVIFAGHEIKASGNVERNLWAASGSVYLDGKVGNQASVTSTLTKSDTNNVLPADQQQQLKELYEQAPGLNGVIPGSYLSVLEIPAGLTLTDNARIEGKLTYSSAEDATFADGSVIKGEITKLEPEQQAEKVEQPQQESIEEVAISQGKSFGVLFMLGLLMIIVCPQSTDGIVSAIFDRPISSLLLGVIGFVFAVVGAFVFFAAIFFLPWLFSVISFEEMSGPSVMIALFGNVLYVGSFLFFCCIGAPACSSMAVGKIVFRGASDDSIVRMVFALGLGLVLYIVTMNVPYLNIVVGVVAFLAGFGGVFLWVLRTCSYGDPKEDGGN